MRVSASVRADVVKVLKRMERELLGKIASGKLTAWGAARVNRQLSEAQRIIAEYYGEASAISMASSAVIAPIAAKVTALAISPSAVLPTETMLSQIASKSVVQGAVQGAWWSKQSADTAFKYSQAVRQGLAAAETNQQIIARVTQALDVSRRQAATLVQTSVATVANDARQAVFDKNQDIIKRYRALATLDTNTCLVCAPLDGKEWLPDGTPIDHNFSLPRYPLHHNCRCLLLARATSGQPRGGRAAAGGPVPASETLDSWISRQSPAKVEELLGTRRAEMFRAGKLSLDDLVNGSGRPLSVAELAKKYES